MGCERKLLLYMLWPQSCLEEIQLVRWHQGLKHRKLETAAKLVSRAGKIGLGCNAPGADQLTSYSALDNMKQHCRVLLGWVQRT